LINFARSLLKNLKLRFAGIFSLVTDPGNSSIDQIYYDDCFLIASFLDPNFKTFWIDALPSDTYNDDIKRDLKIYIKDITARACHDFKSKNALKTTQIENNRLSRSADKPVYVKTIPMKRSGSKSNNRSNSNTSLTREKVNVHSSNANETENLVVNKSDEPRRLFNYKKVREQQQSDPLELSLIEQIGKIYQYSI
jgi:hypothetical protein